MVALDRRLMIVVSVVLALALVGLATLSLQLSTQKPQAGISVSILDSRGRCGEGEPAVKLLESEGEYVVVGFEEPVANPCYRHVIEEVEVIQGEPLRIIVKLRLEKTSEVCIQCLGLVETRLRIGRLSDGAVITVNGLEIAV